MPKTANDVLADALRLEPDSRAEIAAELLASLDGPADPDAEAAWDGEIERRIAAIEAGAIQLEPWSEVKRRLERDLLGHQMPRLARESAKLNVREEKRLAESW